MKSHSESLHRFPQQQAKRCFYCVLKIPIQKSKGIQQKEIISKFHNRQIIGYLLGCIPNSINSVNATFDICYCLDMSLTKNMYQEPLLPRPGTGRVGQWKPSSRLWLCVESPALHLPCRTFQPLSPGDATRKASL